MKRMNISEFDPGHGFRVTEYIASGAWKSAFVGTAPGRPEEIALLCYHSANRRDAVADMSKMMKLDYNLKWSEYLATFISTFNGTDGRLWIAEELLVSPLSNLVKLREIGRFVRIARDLSRGLCCIHDQGYVHRDLKLDNCGMSFSRAKIFDLGSLITEPGEVGCTIVTRPPELLAGQGSEFLGTSDVWALGATLFALCTGSYPFVTPKQVKDRAAWNEAVIRGELSSDEASELKHEMDESVRRRSTEAGAELVIQEKIRGVFRGDVAELLIGMLRFEGGAIARLSAKDAEEGWSRVAGNFAGTAPLIQNNFTQWGRVENLLKAVKSENIVITSRQFNRIVAEWEEVKSREVPFSVDPEAFEKLLNEASATLGKRAKAA